MGAVIVEAVRSAVGKRKGGLAGVHPADLSGTVLTALAERAGIPAAHRGLVARIVQLGVALTAVVLIVSGLFLIGTIFFARRQEKIEEAKAHRPAGTPGTAGAYRVAGPKAD